MPCATALLGDDGCMHNLRDRDLPLHYNGTLTLTRSEGPALAVASLVVPDYASFE